MSESRAAAKERATGGRRPPGLPIADPRKDPAVTASARRRRVSLPAMLAALVGLGLAAVAISRLGLHTVVHALVGVHHGWGALPAALLVF